MGGGYPAAAAAAAADEDDADEDGEAPAGYAMLDDSDDGGGSEAGPGCAGAWDDVAFDDFQGGGALETFADFGPTNAAMPEPPPAPVVVPRLTDDDKRIIRETMQKIDIQPPPWAARLSDKDIHRMIKRISKEVA